MGNKTALQDSATDAGTVSPDAFQNGPEQVVKPPKYILALETKAHVARRDERDAIKALTVAQTRAWATEAAWNVAYAKWARRLRICH